MQALVLLVFLAMAMTSCSDVGLRGGSNASKSDAAHEEQIEAAATPSPDFVTGEGQLQSFTLKVRRFCVGPLSSQDAESSLKDAEAGIVVKLRHTASGKIVVLDQEKLQWRQEILNNKSLTLEATPGVYDLLVCDPRKSECLDPSVFPAWDSASSLLSGTVDAFDLSGGEAPAKEIPLYYGRANIGEFCDQKISPLLIDLSGEGIHLSSQNEGVLFDIDGDGERDQISWPVNGDNAWLVLDRNDNGVIDNIHELFGDQTLGPDSRKAANGFHALTKYDGNADQIVDHQDQVYETLRVWRDFNGDGISNESELISLADVGVESILLTYEEVFEVDMWGNEIRQRSAVKKQDGQMRAIVDVWLRK